MALSHFSSTKATSLSSGMTSNDTAVYLVDGSTYPDPAVPGNGQYSILIGYGSDREEVCTVIAKPGVNQLTVTRGRDGTAAVSKNIGDVVVHGVSARDFENMVTADGATMTGYLTLNGAPTDNLHAATKKYVDDKATAVTGAYTAAIANAMPAGLIAPFGSSTAMPGWLLCNGQSTSGHPLLAAMYGATVPDLRDKFVLGDGGSLPNTGGKETVTLTAAQSGTTAHNHPASSGTDSPDHTHGFTEYQSPDPARGVDPSYTNPALNNIYTAVGETAVGANTGGASTRHSHTVTVSNSTAADASTAHENMPPYYALTFQVRAG